MRRVAIESPYAGDTEFNEAYAKTCVWDCLERGEAPYASHLFFAQEDLLNNEVAEERKLAIDAGKAWGSAADCIVVYTDLGISGGMSLGIQQAKEAGRTIEYRQLGAPWVKPEKSELRKALEQTKEVVKDAAVGVAKRVLDFVGKYSDE